MKIFKDLINGDELTSDSFPMTEVDDIVYEVETKQITKSEGNYDIGGNPSADGADEDEGPAESTVATVNNLVDAMRLVETSFDKKMYMAYIKNYMKGVLAKLKETKPERAEIFQAKVQPFIKKVLGNFDEYSFYTGESMDSMEAMVALAYYKEEAHAPTFVFFKDGLVEEKV
eukprot:TRINITY_DN315_c0_g1_i1.p1 TRINITY_DN315_c0_g1~~TRINITY_DN315_c0_g1_i1.p1  ORF type:complete len:172 (-),score=55.89 TRINITY_DN315_c0_g1_i1:52-567(-)